MNAASQPDPRITCLGCGSAKHPNADHCPECGGTEFSQGSATSGEADEYSSREAAVLRRLLAWRASGGLLYADDGELQDNTAWPHIDFKRDTVDAIESKLGERSRAALAAKAEQAHVQGANTSGERVQEHVIDDYMKAEQANPSTGDKNGQILDAVARNDAPTKHAVTGISRDAGADAMDALVAEQANPPVPPGYKWVPLEPTDHMTFVGQSLRYNAANSIGAIYREMIAAAPSVEQSNPAGAARQGGNTNTDLFKLAQLVVATYDDEHLSAVSLDRAMRNLRDYFAAPVAERAAAPASVPEGDADELHFNAQRLRNVADLVGLASVVPQDDATLDGARGAVLGQIAAKLRKSVAPEVAQPAAQGARAAPSELAAGYESGTVISDASGFGATIRLHYESPAEAENAFEAITDIINDLLAAPAPTAGESSARPDGLCNSARRAEPAGQHGIYSNGCGQHSPKLAECATCNLEIWPPNSLRGYGNYQQYCQCVKVQVRKATAKADINAPSRGRAQGGMHEADDAKRFRQAIALEDNAELLHAATINHAPDGDAIRREFDEGCATQGRKEGKP